MSAEELDRLYRDELVRYARRLLGDAHCAEDMVQEMLLRYAQQTNVIDNPRAWAFRVVRNLCLNELRNRTHLEPIAERELDGHEDEPFASFAQSEFQRALADCIDALKPEQRTILQRRFDGQTQIEIAKGLGKSNAHISRVATASSNSLRDCLGGKGFVEQP